jgi:hypothetical protein
MIPSKQDDIDHLVDLLEKIGPYSIANVCKYFGRSEAYIHAIVKDNPKEFDIVRIEGKIGSAVIAIADRTRPIQLDMGWEE